MRLKMMPPTNPAAKLDLVRRNEWAHQGQPASLPGVYF
jgi:hypothetical protein